MKKRQALCTVPLLVLLFIGVYALFRSINDTPYPQQETIVTKSDSISEDSSKKSEPTPRPYQEPVVEFEDRASKKKFGVFITPTNSPTPPERFSGYHTGVDVEFDDVQEEVTVSAITNGTVLYSGFVNGYGGVALITHTIKGAPRTVVYGHLDPASLLGAQTKVKKGQSIGVLGASRTTQTDGERKHLHFAILSDTRQDFRGYVQEESQLSGWLNPLALY